MAEGKRYVIHLDKTGRPLLVRRVGLGWTLVQERVDSFTDKPGVDLANHVSETGATWRRVKDPQDREAK